MVKCTVQGCKIRAIFGYEDYKPLYCFNHTSVSDPPKVLKQVVLSYCDYPDCKQTPHYGIQVGNPTRCSKHFIDGMKNVNVVLCREVNCFTRPVFGYKGTKIPLTCSKHAHSDMCNILNKICEFEGCDTQAGYGFEQHKPLRCKTHILNDMVNVVTKSCEIEGCKKRRVYGYEKGKATVCKDHAQPDMKDVHNRKCEICDVYACFGYEREKRPSRCSEHTLNGMTDLQHKKCEECKTIATYGYAKYKPIRCSKHFIEGMKNVVSKMCNVCDEIIASYGYERGKPQVCVAHISEGMFDVTRDKCKMCDRLPYFGFKKGETEYCVRHAEKGMKDFKNKYCKKDKCGTRVSGTKYGEFCYYCFIAENPDVVISKYHKFKEEIVINHIRSSFSSLPFIFNRKISKTCNRYPDALLNIPSLEHIIIIEVDENRHASYDEEDELDRSLQIYEEFNKPVIFIRFNPDSYKNPITQKRVTSCFKVDTKTQTLCVARKKELEFRLNELTSVINKCLSSENVRKSNKTIRLFF